MKRFWGYLAVMGLLAALSASPALGDTYFIYEQYGGTWHDANKTAANTEDDLMCWAAAASNILAWGHWGTATYNTADLIFKHFQDHWTDNTGFISWGLAWWIYGFEPGYKSISYVDVPGGGNFYPQLKLNFNYYYVGASEGNLMATIDSLMHQGKCVGLSIGSSSGSHALTAWGFEYTSPGAYTSIFFTDSDDGLPGLRQYALVWRNNAWYLGTKLDGYGGYSLTGWKINSVQALGYLHTPIAPSWVLFGTGVFSLFLCRRRRRGKS
uniref:Uncharacterized protein n=1 Tax=Desulfobacca acetoxidans TaxID=60893 RepID=A0A7V4LDF2_9BACT